MRAEPCVLVADCTCTLVRRALGAGGGECVCEHMGFALHVSTFALLAHSVLVILRMRHAVRAFRKPGHSCQAANVGLAPK